MLRRIDVLDYGGVELLDVMPHDIPQGAESRDIAIVQAARTSYLSEMRGAEQDKKLLKYLYKHHHTSPFEQVQLKFRISAPIVVWWHIDRHRTIRYGHLNRQSGRYTEYPETFYTPSVWRLQDGDNKQGSYGEVSEKAAEALNKAYRKHVLDSFSYYKSALELGVAKELARIFLPAFSLYHTTVVTADLWNLLHFLSLRLPDNAQYETRQYAEAIAQIVEEFFPWTWEAFEENSSF